MYNNKIAQAIAAVMLLTIGNRPFAAQEVPAQVMVNIAPCIAIAGEDARLACFDALVADSVDADPASGSVVSASPPTPVTVATPAPVPVLRVPESTTAASGPDAVESFGVQTPEGARVQANTEGDMVLYDRIAKVEEREPGRWLITLASGQRWYQSNSQRLRLRVGMDVRIYPSPLGGSFRMARNDGESTGFIQVSRVQ
jgi:hypothetical protein